MRLSLVALVALAALVAAEEWSAGNFPNPTAGEFQKCGMKTSANICDPDGVLSESARYRLDHDLKQLESRTRQENAPSFCDKKGVTAAMAIARHVKGGSEAAVREMANDMLRRWTLDPQCQKAIVIVVSTDDMKFWVARDDKVPVYAEEFTELFMSQRNNFQQSNYQGALTNILQGTWEKAISKQGSPKLAPGSGGGGGGQGGFGGGGMGGGGGQGGGGMGGGGAGMPQFKMPSIPKWFWTTLILVIIPLLCCCCCLYCCCCRGKGGGAAASPQMGPDGQPMNGGGGGQRRGGGCGQFFNTFAASGIGSMAGRMISQMMSGGGRRQGGGGGMGMGGMGGGGGGYQGGGAYPADRPVYDDNGGQGGAGLYPSRAVKDQGGGGSWA